MNEVGLNAKWLRADMTHKETQEFSRDVLNHMRERLSDYQEMYGDLYNLEATPAESTSYRFAKHDRQKWPDIITATDNAKAPYYTNSSHLPVGYTEDIFDALDIQDELQTLYTSGTVFHAFLGEKLPTWKSAANLVRKIAENYKLPYYTMSPTYSVCTEHGYINGEEYTCPKCGKTTEVYSRITGYYRPVQAWNDGKSQEFKERRTYNVERSNELHPEINIGSDGVRTINAVKEPSAEECACEAATENRVMLFATKTCPNCKIASEFLDKAGISYEKLYADENLDLIAKYGIKQAPTLVVVEDGLEIAKAANLSNIRKYIESVVNA
jgi:ribonucleoside-triphosphate reductase